jgi:hypothetical protein
MFKITTGKFKEIEQQIAEGKLMLENGITNPDKYLESALPNMELMLKTLETIRGVAEGAEDSMVIEYIANLLDTTNAV